LYNILQLRDRIGEGNSATYLDDGLLGSLEDFSEFKQDCLDMLIKRGKRTRRDDQYPWNEKTIQNETLERCHLDYLLNSKSFKTKFMEILEKVDKKKI